MKATAEQVERVYRLRQQGITKCNHLIKETQYSKSVIESAQKIIRQSENELFASQDRAKKMDRLLSFAHPPHEIERGRSKGGYVNTPTCDRSPTPSGIPLTVFVSILTEPHQEFVSTRLPKSEWLDERGLR